MVPAEGTGVRDLRRAAIVCLAQENGLGALLEVVPHDTVVPSEQLWVVPRVGRRVLAEGHLQRESDSLFAKPLLHGAVDLANQSLKRPHMDHQLDVAQVHSALGQELLLHVADHDVPVGGPPLAAVGRYGSRRIRNLVNDGLLDVGPRNPSSLLEDGLRDGLRREHPRVDPLRHVLDLQNERLLLGIHAKDIDIGLFQPAVHGKRLERREPWDRGDASRGALDEDGLEAPFSCRERRWRRPRLGTAVAPHDVVEMPGDRRLAERLLLGLGVVDKHEDVARGIPPALSSRQGSLRHGAHGAQKPVLVDEWDEDHALPLGPLALDVDEEVDRVKVLDRRVDVRHQVPIRLRKQLATGRRLDRHELLVGQERSAGREGHRDGRQVDQVRHHGRIVVRVVPVPRRDTPVVVLQHPVQALDERADDPPPVCRLGRFQLLPVVPLLPRRQPLVPVTHLKELPGFFAHHGRLLLHGLLLRASALCFRLAALHGGQELQLVALLLQRLQGSKVHGLGQILHIEVCKGCVHLARPVPPIPLRLELFGLLGPLLERLGLMQRQVCEEDLNPSPVQAPRVRQIASHLRQQPLIRREHEVQRSLVDVAGGQRRQKVVSDQHAEEHKVVNHPLDVKLEGQRRRTLIELQLHVVPEQPDLQQHKVLLARVLEGLPQRLSLVLVVDHLAEQAKVWLVRDQGQHDQVGIQAVQAVPQVGLVVRRLLAPANVLHDLVLSLPGDVVARQDNRWNLPKRIFRHLVSHEELEVLGESFHEGRPGRDAVRVERRHLTGPFRVAGFFQCLFRSMIRRLSCRLEPPSTLLVHLCTGRDAVDGHKHELLGLDDVEQLVEVHEDLFDHLFFRQFDVWVVPVRAIMDDAIHIEVEVVDDRDDGGTARLVDQRVALR